jgi:hypothetical protein
MRQPDQFDADRDRGRDQAGVSAPQGRCDSPDQHEHHGAPQQRAAVFHDGRRKPDAEPVMPQCEAGDDDEYREAGADGGSDRRRYI